MNYRALPKVELHLHLDCSLSYDVVSRIEPSLSRQQYESDFIAPDKCRDLADFLTRAQSGIQIMQTEEQLRRVTEDLFTQLLHENVIYAEMRFAPLQHLKGGLTAEDVTGVVENAVARGIRETGIQARVILCTLRHFTEMQSMETVRLVQRFKGTNIAGFDIAADEASYPIDAHKAAFADAHTQRIPCTAHAGEARGPESVWETLRHFRPSRIGHGVRSIEDPKLVKHLHEQGIHLEVCPSCNVQIDIYDRYQDHPINKLFEAGVSVGVNTDARTITNIELTDEYTRLHDVFGWTKAHFLRCNQNAVQAAFIADGLKKNLIKQLEGAYAE